MKICRCVALFWAVGLLAVAPSHGQDIGGFELIPVVGHTAGAGQPPTYWVTDVTIHNLMSERVTVGMVYFPFDTDNEWDETFPVTVQLEPRETMLVEDVLGTYFAVTGSAKGAVLLSCDRGAFPENPDDSVMMVENNMQQ